ncbi:MAG TPA: glycosyl hydrolase family 18 protein [Candidatus Limnocylindria bacterium]|nr:glycosyl hydrolase family 18 protein [Candidatus Limnocylindria bacterium]
MTRRLLALLLLALLPFGQWLAPGPALANGPAHDPDAAPVTSNGRRLPPLPAELRQPSVHAEMLARQGARSYEFEPGAYPALVLDGRGAPKPSAAGVAADADALDQAAPAAARLPNGLRKEVFGFLPYWMLTDAALDEMKYSLLSTVAYFSVNVNAQGYLVKGTASQPSSGWAGWTSSRMTEVLERAHAKGVKVVITVTMMAWDSASAARQEALLTSSSARSRLINQIVNAIALRGADGVNLDFEPLAVSLRDEYVSFVKQLKARLVAAGVGDYLTVCVMAGAATWATGYDVAGLTSAGAADALFVMGYDYHWSGSSRAGGVAPINSPYTIDVDGTMLDFLAETSGSKLIWGVPYYGRTWPTTTRALNAPTRGYGSKAYTYTGHLAEAARYGRLWDDVGKVPWYRYWDRSLGSWVQGYYDDRRSLGIKYDLVNARGLAGTGMWTLLMDRGRDELWRLLADKFVNDTDPPAGGIRVLPPSTDGTSVKVSWRAVDEASGVAHYNVQVRPEGGSWRALLSRTRATSTWFSGRLDARYEFRVQAVDWRGNAQAWVSVPDRPPTVRAGAFARVVIPSINVRSGPGTGYGVITTRPQDDRVYVLEGPVSASGYQWFRVQYRFSEWPSADFPSVGWMALGSASEAYLAPALAPTITRLAPFVRELAATPAFSPNADGRTDTARVSFTLLGAAEAVRLDILGASGGVVRSIELGPRSAGAHSATWDGRLAAGSAAPEGVYLPRVVAVDADGSHYAPGRRVRADLLAAYGMNLDVTRPTITRQAPVPGSLLVAATQPVVVEFSEPMQGLDSAGMHLAVGDVTLSALNAVHPGRAGVTITASAPLPVATQIWVRATTAVADLAGNPLGARRWTFATAPGTAYDPARTLRLAAGRHVAYRLGAQGGLSGAREASLDGATSALVGHRSELPNLPGRWLHVEDGVLAGRWIRESAVARLRGEVERLAFGSSVHIRVLPGTHTGVRFDAAGRVTAQHTSSLADVATPRVRARVIVNGVPYLAVASGRWIGYLLRESSVAHRPGAVDRIAFPALTAIRLTQGTHVGFRYDSDGNVLSRKRASLAGTALAHAGAWAVINGVPHFRVVDGPLAGTWVPETAAVRLTV